MFAERPRGAFPWLVLTSRLWGDAPLYVVDVGCSGGIEERWFHFGDRLKAVGFDPLVAEIDRLNGANVRPNVRYEAAFVGCRNYDELFPPALRNDRVRSQDDGVIYDPSGRLSSFAALSRLEMSYEQSVFNRGAPVVLSDRKITLDDYIPEAEHASVDFVKIDTDGHDIEVILGATRIMSAHGILGLVVESPFQGPRHEYANTFSNIDRLLRRHGFTLFDLSACRYSRACLPAPFVLDIPAHTTSGQLVWGDALYFRDLGSLDYERMWPGYDMTAERVMKLACLFDFYELPDCAAELLVNRGQFLEGPQREQLLDLLVTGEAGSYAAHIAAFEADFTAFFPSRVQRPAEPLEASGHVHGSDEPLDAEAVRRVQDRVTELKAENVMLRRRLKARDAKLEKLENRVSQLRERRGKG